MATGKVKLNAVFDLDFDGDELSVLFGGTDVTSEFKEVFGSEVFRDLQSSFLPKSRDKYQAWKDEKLVSGDL